MEKRLCYCTACESFFIISPDKTCPKCQGKMISSVITEEEWNRSNAEQKTAYKNSLTAVSNTTVDGQKKHTDQNIRPTQEAKT